MNKRSLIRLLVLLGTMWAPFAALNAEGVTFYVSLEGNDTNPGTRESPFATVFKARDEVRLLEKDEAVQIILREGIYYLSEPLSLTPEDSGSEAAPITWRAETGEKVVLSGGRPILGQWRTKDGVIWSVDLPTVETSGWNFRQLFVDGVRMTRARYPNKSEANPFLYAKGGSHSIVRMDKSRIKASWGQAEDAQINIVPNWKFFNQWNTVEAVNLKNGALRLADSERHGKITKGNWFWIEGVREELDEPGEWFLNTKEGRLDYIPLSGKNPNEQTIIAPYLERIVHAVGDVEQRTHVEYVNFSDLQFRHTRFTLGHIEARVHTDTAIFFQNARNCSVSRCHFENIGGYALWLHLDSQANRFDQNTVFYAGGGGVLMTGARFSYMDDSKLFTPGEVAATVFPILNRITRSTVKHSGKIRYYGGGVHLDSRPASMAMAPGNYIAHNHFQDLSRNGIFAFRNQGGNVVEYNHIHDVMQTTIDGAAIHFATMNHLNAPNFILNNYLYDIWGYEQKPNGQAKRHLANGVFLDWATSNTTVKNNYIYNAGGEPIKNIMGNWNLEVTDNRSSDTPITPDFVDQIGPEGTASHLISLSENRLIGSVIHYTDEALVEYGGAWKQKTIDGFWNLFSFNMLEAEPTGSAKISYTLPISESGNYQVSLLYLPEENNATNARISVKYADGVSNQTWNMEEGNEYGFAIEIGEFPFKEGGTAQVEISNSNANGTVVVDSVAFVKVAEVSSSEKHSPEHFVESPQLISTSLE